MSSGFYKRRRGILEHIEAGKIDLLESGIHDYLLLKANLVTGSSCSIPVGVVYTSAPALHPYYRRVSERTIQRHLDHLQKIGWIKMFKTPGKRGNYPVLICRASVHDLSGKEYRINADKTTDWKHAVIEPVGEMSVRCPESVRELSGDRELRSDKGEERETKPRAAKPAAPADLRYQPFVDYAFESFRRKHGQPPTWGDKDFANLKSLLGKNKTLASAELERRWGHYSASTEAFIAKRGDSLAYFCSNFDSFINGPILSASQENKNGRGDSASITEQNLRNLGLAGQKMAGDFR